MERPKEGVTKYSWQLINLYQQYQRETGEDVVNLDDVYEWANGLGLYKEPPMDPGQRFKRDMARALRSQHHTDPQNRQVRTMLPVVVKPGPNPVVLWADSRIAKPKHAHTNLQQYRLAILASCKRHKTTADSYNDNNPYGATLPLFDYDFTKDIEESGFPTNYPDERPKD